VAPKSSGFIFGGAVSSIVATEEKLIPPKTEFRNENTDVEKEKVETKPALSLTGKSFLSLGEKIPSLVSAPLAFKPKEKELVSGEVFKPSFSFSSTSDSKLVFGSFQPEPNSSDRSDLDGGERKKRQAVDEELSKPSSEPLAFSFPATPQAQTVTAPVATKSFGLNLSTPSEPKITTPSFVSNSGSLTFGSSTTKREETPSFSFPSNPSLSTVGKVSHDQPAAFVPSLDVQPSLPSVSGPFGSKPSTSFVPAGSSAFGTSVASLVPAQKFSFSAVSQPPVFGAQPSNSVPVPSTPQAPTFSFGKQSIEAGSLKFGTVMDRASCSATPPPPLPIGSESPGTMDTGYAGDTNNIPNGNLAPVTQASTFGSSFNFLANPTPKTFGSSTQTQFGSAPNLPTPVFGMVNPAPAFGAPTPAPFGGTNSTPVAFGAATGLNPVFAAPKTSQFGQMGGLASDSSGVGSFSIGAPDKNSQSKGRRRMKATWKPLS